MSDRQIEDEILRKSVAKPSPRRLSLIDCL
jgi:hypothetical protein